jgi:CubicO group peptidase (beta-lactamase class C family)
MGMDEAKLIEARDYAVGTNGGGGSGFVTRHGRVVMTWGDVASQWEVKSITKSVGATLLGLAIKDGLMSLADAAQLHHPSLGVPPDSNTTTGWLDDIQVLNLATHTAGFEETARYGAVVYEPGTASSYSDGGANWLAEAVTLTFGQDALSVLRSRVLSPLGVSFGDLSWRNNLYREQEIAGVTNREFGSGISTNVDVLARLGYLYLRDGVWDGTEILPAGYVATATAPVPGLESLPSLHPTYPDAAEHYGLHWWNNADGSMPTVPTDTYFAWGLNEGLIVVIPSLDIVATRLGNAWRISGQDPHYPVVEPFIRSVVESVPDP